jgi:TPR repeat protein
MGFSFRFILIVFTLTLFINPVWGDELEEGFDAFNNGDYKLALDKFKRLAEQGDALAQFAIYEGKFRFQAELRDELAVGEAHEWLEEAAKNGYAPAQYELGVYFEQGYNGSEWWNLNYEKALKLFNASAKQGYVEAELKLGEIHMMGLEELPSFPIDYQKAIKWFKLAAEKGNFFAQYNLGIIFKGDFGNHKDLVQSYRWFYMAELRSPVSDHENSLNVKKEMTPSQIKEAEELVEDFIRECLRHRYGS